MFKRAHPWNLQELTERNKLNNTAQRCVLYSVVQGYGNSRFKTAKFPRELRKLPQFPLLKQPLSFFKSATFYSINYVAYLQ